MLMTVGPRGPTVVAVARLKVQRASVNSCLPDLDVASQG